MQQQNEEDKWDAPREASQEEPPDNKERAQRQEAAPTMRDREQTSTTSFKVRGWRTNRLATEQQEREVKTVLQTEPPKDKDERKVISAVVKNINTKESKDEPQQSKRVQVPNHSQNLYRTQSHQDHARVQRCKHSQR